MKFVQSQQSTEAIMKASLVISTLATLLSMAVAIIVFGQRQMISRLSESLQQIQTTVQMRAEAIEESRYLHNLLQQQLEKVKKNVQELDTELPKQKEELKKKQASLEDCKTKKANTDGEVAGQQKEQTDTEATINHEKESWAGEIATLKVQIQQESPVCSFVKRNSTDAKKLCPSA